MKSNNCVAIKTNERRSKMRNMSKFVENFGVYLKAFDDSCPFRKSGQLEYHRLTIDIRRKLGSVKNAVEDDDFLKNLYFTLQAL